MGPSVSVLLKRKLNDTQKEDFTAFLTNISSNIEKGNYETLGYNFWIENASPIGYSYKGIGLPFGVNFGSLEYEKLEEHEVNAIEKHFGFNPMDEIVMVAFCNDDDSHKILGHLALLVAERYGGVIDLTGAITPPIKENRSIKDHPYCTIEEIRSFANEIKGKICEILYETGQGKQWVYHIVDYTFLKNWLQHKHFHMIK